MTPTAPFYTLVSAPTPSLPAHPQALAADPGCLPYSTTPVLFTGFSKVHSLLSSARLPG